MTIVKPEHEHFLLYNVQLMQRRQTVEIVITPPKMVQVDAIAHLEVFAPISGPRYRIRHAEVFLEKVKALSAQVLSRLILVPSKRRLIFTCVFP